MSKKRKLKKSAKLSLLLIIALIIGSIYGVKFYKDYKYKQTYEYKLLQINYTLDETKVLTKYLVDSQLDEILKTQANPNIVKFISEKYFIYKNLDRYLKYIEKNEEVNYSDVISMVNVNRDRDYYTDIISSKVEDGKLLLVNKYHNLSSDYEPENIIKTSATYSYAGNSLNEETYNAYKNLAEEAKTVGHTILIISSYRTYSSQDELWNERKSLYGTRKADSYAARAGHSEHQSGYAVDVGDFYDVNDKFGETESFTWMIDNAHKFGFILRYPKDKEEITGYSYEPWHYRYVGKDTALKIYNEKITFDEYHAYYLEK